VCVCLAAGPAIVPNWPALDRCWPPYPIHIQVDGRVDVGTLVVNRVLHLDLAL
jgi:hypothetical protein